MARKKSFAAAPPEGPVQTPPSDQLPHMNGTKGSPPVWKKRVQTRGASIEVAVFKHEVDQGQASFSTFSITLDRSYKDGEGKWHTTHSFRRDDLLAGAHLLQRAYAWISEQKLS